MHAALDDAKERLVFSRVRCLATLSPCQGALYSSRDVFLFCGVRRALIELHDDIGADLLLDAHIVLGCPTVLAAVYDRREVDPVGIELERVCQREDLETAAIGEDGFIPAHELMDAAGAFDDVGSRAVVEMVGVGEDDLRPELFERVGHHAFDGSGGSHRHEDGGLDIAMRRMEATPARGCLGVFCYEVELEHLILLCRRKAPCGMRVRRTGLRAATATSWSRQTKRSGSCGALLLRRRS